MNEEMGAVVTAEEMRAHLKAHGWIDDGPRQQVPQAAVRSLAALVAGRMAAREAEVRREEREHFDSVMEEAWACGDFTAARAQDALAFVANKFRARKTEGSGAGGVAGSGEMHFACSPRDCSRCGGHHPHVYECPPKPPAPSPEPAPAVEEEGDILSVIAYLDHYPEQQQTLRAIAVRLQAREALVEALVVAAGNLMEEHTAKRLKTPSERAHLWVALAQALSALSKPQEGG